MKTLAYLLRSVFLGLIIFKCITGGISAALGKTIIFVVMLPLLWLARRDARYYFVDASLSALFIVSWSMTFFGFPLVSSVFGLDKLFHFLAGAIVGYCGLLVLSAYKKQKFFWLAWTLAMLSVLIGWECYEWIEFIFTPSMQLTMLDSVLDVIIGGIGAVIVIVYVAIRFRADRA